MSNKQVQDEVNNWLEGYEWTHMITTTMESRISDSYLKKLMDGVSRKKKVKRLVWFREFTGDRIPHIHGVIDYGGSTDELKRTMKTLGNTKVDEFQYGRNGTSYISKTIESADSLWDFKL